MKMPSNCHSPKLSRAATGVELLLPIGFEMGRGIQASLATGLRAYVRSGAHSCINAGTLSRVKRRHLRVRSERYWKVEPRALKSQGKNTPFIALKSKVKCATRGRGQIVLRRKIALASELGT